MAEQLTWSVDAALAVRRSRASWNERLLHWERPASDHEEAKIQRAASTAVNLIRNNGVLTNEAVTIRPQGSYFNNTNVRLEADMDIRVQLPNIFIQYSDGVNTTQAYEALGYRPEGRTFEQISSIVRAELAADCRAIFGNDAVTVGNKAITVAGLSGSRADVDLVPAFHLHWIINNRFGNLDAVKGTTIIGAQGPPIFNFPEQHHSNGVDKRNRTQHRFKKLVRMLKRLNYELADLEITSRRVPSFFVECLVYTVEDDHFLYDEDRYDRLLRVVRRIHDLVHDANWCSTALEINDWKFLFHPAQAWTIDDARNFISAAFVRLSP